MKDKTFQRMENALAYAIIVALIAFVLALATTGNAQPMTYEQLQKAYEDCYPVPASYSQPNTPKALGLKDPCAVPHQPTIRTAEEYPLYYYYNETITVYAVKVKAVSMYTMAGGLHSGLWLAKSFGSYTASEGYYGVFSGLLYSQKDAELEMIRLQALGYCDARIYKQAINLQTKALITNVYGSYKK